MGRAEMLARMDSQELTGWMALLKVHEHEREQADEMARLRAESNDGEVVVHGKPRTEFDYDDED